MPRKTKEQKELENEVLSTVKSTSSTKKTSSKSATKKSEKNTPAKEVTDVVESEKPKKTTKSKKSSAESTASTKKVSAKISAKTDTKISAKSASKSDSKTTKKSDTKSSKKAASSTSTLAKKAASEKKPVAKKATSEKKPATKKVASEKKPASKKAVTKTTTKATTKTKKAVAEKKTAKKSDSKKADVVEYYDLPYRYNQTVVKLLAQTPTNLFVYWDISDADRENFKKQYGYNFFERTRPILIVHNDTMNYSFEVEINDFANCWYLHVNDSNCDYRIELGRKPVVGYVQNWQPSEEDLKDENSEINKYPSKPIDRDYFYITTSNQLESPNDHILFNKHFAPQSIQIRNVKTNEQYSKPISALSLKNNMHKIYNIYDLYRELYKEVNIEDIFDLSNPSSGNPSSGNPSSGSFSSKFK